MLKALKFVQGAVAKRDYHPALTHFRIANGRVLGFNGLLALSSPIDLDLSATPKAAPFVKAIECCKETVAIHLTGAGKLAVKSGGFRAYIECLPEDDSFPGVGPEGEEIPVAGELLNALRTLEPFIGIDASRPWATGVLFKGGSAFATNNIIVAEYWLGYDFPTPVNVPAAAVKELIRIGKEPEKLTVGKNSMTFHFAGGQWLRTQLYSTDWPDLSRILDRPANLKPFPDGLFEAIETISAFVGDDGRIFFRGDHITTSPEPGAGAAVEVPGLPNTGAFHYTQLALLQIADQIDFSDYPNPCSFRGKNMRGVILGMRDE